MTFYVILILTFKETSQTNTFFDIQYLLSNVILSLKYSTCVPVIDFILVMMLLFSADFFPKKFSGFRYLSIIFEPNSSFHVKQRKTGKV